MKMLNVQVVAERQCRGGGIYVFDGFPFVADGGTADLWRQRRRVYRGAESGRIGPGYGISVRDLLRRERHRGGVRFAPRRPGLVLLGGLYLLVQSAGDEKRAECGFS